MSDDFSIADVVEDYIFVDNILNKDNNRDAELERKEIHDWYKKYKEKATKDSIEEGMKGSFRVEGVKDWSVI